MIVIAPSRPQNIRTMINNRPNVSSCLVTPNDRPVVENAETTSNSAKLRLNAWLNRSSQVAVYTKYDVPQGFEPTRQAGAEMPQPNHREFSLGLPLRGALRLTYHASLLQTANAPQDDKQAGQGN